MVFNICMHPVVKMKMEEMKSLKCITYELLDQFEQHIRVSFANKEQTDDLSTDLIWYLWTGKYSSLFGKRAMTTFERYFIKDKLAQGRKKSYYYLRRQSNVS